MDVINFLFRKSSKGFKPQIGFAGPDKRAWLWLPGKETRTAFQGIDKLMGDATFNGSTQLAFQDWFVAAKSQICEVCWVGLDIDHDDNPSTDLCKWSQGFAKEQGAAVARSSCSGKGVHIMWVLEEPIICSNAQAGQIVKDIAMKYKLAAEAEGIHVCQANRRMFWLNGGDNVPAYEDIEAFISPDIGVTLENARVAVITNKGYTEKIMEWVNEFHRLGVFKGNVTDHNAVYVGDVVKVLRDKGETVYTKSGCSGNGQVNGYIDIDYATISLWTYADGHTVWTFTDLEAMLA